MGSRLNEIVIDCHDPKKLAEFWCAVLDYRIIDENEDEVEINHGDVTKEDILAGPIAPSLLFIRVPEDKTVKNRLHLDVNPINVAQEVEVERLIGLGARHVDIGQGEQSWVVLADPDGNEFCVLRTISSEG
jgi:catechol 2,3-dioxygenase-like lactoylglutathione lyase family enzyme